MIYLDNSATSYPKPECVIESVKNAFTEYGANSGRGAYDMAIKTSEQIYCCRKKIAEFFGLDKSDNVIFTHNCTTALNTAIKGIAHKDSHFVISDMEHNAVLRPLQSLKNQGISDFSIAKICDDMCHTVKNFENCIQKNTVAIVCTAASNVFGVITPYKFLSELAHRHKILFILDASQVAGVIPVNVTEDNIDILCCSGHKGLLGPTGVGMMLVNCNERIMTFIEGGTGTDSLNPLQPEFYPDRFESGTPNICGIIGLSSAVDFINDRGLKEIYAHEIRLIKYLYNNLRYNNKIQFYTAPDSASKKYAPILSFNIKNIASEETARFLSENNIAVRAGLHCAPLAHNKFRTLKTGTVRISPSVFTEKNEIEILINCIRKIAK